MRQCVSRQLFDERPNNRKMRISAAGRNPSRFQIGLSNIPYLTPCDYRDGIGFRAATAARIRHSHRGNSTPLEHAMSRPDNIPFIPLEELSRCCAWHACQRGCNDRKTSLLFVQAVSELIAAAALNFSAWRPPFKSKFHRRWSFAGDMAVTPRELGECRQSNR